MKKSKWLTCARGKCATKISMIMRLCYFFMLVLSFQVSAEGLAQGTVNVTFKNESLGEVLKEFKQQTGVYFMYNTREVDADVKVSAELRNVLLEKALEIIFKDLPYTYARVNDYFLIMPKRSVVADTVQGKVVKGIVRDDKKEILPGVTILIKGTKLGTVTDANGKFELNLPDKKEVTLVFSFIGMATKELKADTTFMNVTMKESALEVDEVVVTGYERIERRKLTSSVLSVRGEDLLEGGAISLDQMLQGKLAGVAVLQATSTPGAAPKIRIRGSSSITGNREPVWVVDGVILNEPVAIPAEELNSLDKINLIGNAISSLNPEDIERVDILKDASATAIYGTKAANGVIVVTTKKGRRGAPTFSYTANLSVMTPPNNKNMERMNSKDRIEMSEEMQERGLEYNGFKPSNVAYEGAVMDFWDKKITYNEFLDKVKELKEMNTDWYDLLFHTAFSHAHTINVSGGGDKSDYYFSGGFANNESVTKNENLRRYNAMMKMNTYFTDALRMGFKLSGAWTKTERPHSSIDLYDYAYNTSRAIPAYDKNGDLFYYAEANGYEKSQLLFNIFNELKHSGSDVDNTSIDMSVTLDWDVTSWLRYNMMFSYARSNTSQSYWADEQSYYISEMRYTPYGSILPDPKIDTYFAKYFGKIPYGGELQSQETRSMTYTWRHSVAFNKLFGVHGISANAGFEIRSSKYDGLKSTQYGYLPERGKKFVNIDMKLWPQYMELVRNHPDVITDTKDNFVSYYGTFSYEYDRRYILNFNIRADGSNKFGQDKSVRFLPVWSVSGRWNVKNESFLTNFSPIDDLSVRVSYGAQGNVNSDQTPNLIVNIGTYDATAQQNSSSLYKFPNTRLKWEKTNSFNLGVDFSFLKNILSGTIEVYRKKGKDQVVTKSVAPSTGANQISYNAGNVENKGWELSVSLRPIYTKNWTWDISFNTSKNYNRVTNAGEQVLTTWRDYTDGTLVTNGKALNSFYSYKFNGLDTDGLPTFKDINEKDEDGNMLVHSQLEAYERAFAHSGKREPDLSGGFSTYVRYKAFALSAQFAFNLGNKMRLNDLYESSGQQLPHPSQNMSTEYVNRWRKPGDEKYTNIPVLSEEGLTISDRDYEYPIGSSGWDMYNKSDLRVVSGNFLRCRSLSLRYAFSAELCKRLYMKGASLSLDAGNLFVLKSKELKGRDPEQAIMGSHTVPPQRSYSLRLNVTF